MTPHGKKLSEEAFKDINPREHQININQQGDDQWNCRVSRLSSTNKYQCFFKAVEEEGSAFGGCSCDYPKTHGLPCHHMVAVVKSCCIEGLNCVNTMPPWWMTAHWCKKYPKGTHVLCDFDIKTLRLALPDTSYKYCPPYAAPNKAGRPKKNKRIKSALEVATEQKQKQKKVKGTIGKVDGNLKSQPLFELLDKAMVSGKVMSVGRSGVEMSAESGVYKVAARKKRADDGGDGAVAVRRSNRAK